MVCDSQPGGREFSGVLHAAITGGVDIVQLREKQLADEELTEVVRTAHAVCEQMGALLIVNDRPKVAVTAGADGVHVGQDDIPVAQVRELVGPDLLIGLSTHSLAETQEATGNLSTTSASGPCTRHQPSPVARRWAWSWSPRRRARASAVLRNRWDRRLNLPTRSRRGPAGGSGAGDSRCGGSRSRGTYSVQVDSKRATRPGRRRLQEPPSPAPDSDGTEVARDRAGTAAQR